MGPCGKIPVDTLHEMYLDLADGECLTVCQTKTARSLGSWVRRWPIKTYLFCINGCLFMYDVWVLIDRSDRLENDEKNHSWGEGYIHLYRNKVYVLRLMRFIRFFMAVQEIDAAGTLIFLFLLYCTSCSFKHFQNHLLCLRL